MNTFCVLSGAQNELLCGFSGLRGRLVALNTSRIACRETLISCSQFSSISFVSLNIIALAALVSNGNGHGLLWTAAVAWAG